MIHYTNANGGDLYVGVRHAVAVRAVNTLPESMCELLIAGAGWTQVNGEASTVAGDFDMVRLNRSAGPIWVHPDHGRAVRAIGDSAGPEECEMYVEGEGWVRVLGSPESVAQNF